MGIDLGRMFQQIGTGIEHQLVVEIVYRDKEGCVIKKLHVPIVRAALLPPGPARICIEQSAIDNAKEISLDLW